MAGSEESDINQTQDDSGRNEEDIINILVATDIHLGYAEKDPIRGQDTFVTFEEILQIAVSKEVDFLLLGGDLFHEARPSSYCIYKCTELFKKYCLGDRPISIEYLSDPSHNFSHVGNTTVNYEDPNLNIGLPVFSIHGNHDDPTGEYQISSLNLMASTGLVNYFGKCDDHSNVKVEPILLKKGETNLALYGLSHVKDERLGRLFLDKKVSFMSPSEQDDWFHLLVWHQNRAARAVKNYIPDHTLPSFLDLVIWGHEHDCRIEPEETENKVYISQPGSSVATSLSLGESIPKNVGLLKIHKKHFSMTALPLTTVRPFIFSNLLLEDLQHMDLDDDGDAITYSDASIKIVEEKINSMITQAKDLGRRGNMLPLIRLNVEYIDEKQVFNAIRFGQKYMDIVANPEDMVKIKPHTKKSNTKGKGGVLDSIYETGITGGANRVEDLVLKYFQEEGAQQLRCMSVKALNEAVIKCIDSNDIDAPSFMVEHLSKMAIEKLDEEVVPVDQVDEFILNLKETRENDMDWVDGLLNEPSRKKHDPRKSTDIDSESDDEHDVSVASTSKATRGTPTRPARGPGSRGGRGSRGARGGRGRAAKNGF